MMNLKETIERIDRMKEDRIIGDYAIGGAVAAGFYIEVAATEDVDVFAFMSVKDGFVDVGPLYAYARAQGYAIDGLYIIIGGWKVQFLTSGPATPLYEEAIRDAVERDEGDFKVRVFTPEHLMAIAIKVGRPKDHTRLAQFLEASSSDEKPRFDEIKLTEILERHQLTDQWMALRRRLGI